MLDYRVETFLTAAKTLNYTTAAKLLHITQPAVSTHIRQLEEEYQTKLFEQKGKQLNLTENGHLFFQLASRMKNDDHHMRQHFLSDAAFQELSFGTTLTIADYCMKEPLMRLWKQFPNLRLRLTVQNTDVLLDQIQCGQLDLAIVEGYVPKEAFDHALFQSQEYIAVCHPDHVFSREVRSLQDLCGEPLFIREPGSGTPGGPGTYAVDAGAVAAGLSDRGGDRQPAYDQTVCAGRPRPGILLPSGRRKRTVGWAAAPGAAQRADHTYLHLCLGEGQHVCRSVSKALCAVMRNGRGVIGCAKGTGDSVPVYFAVFICPVLIR